MHYRNKNNYPCAFCSLTKYHFHLHLTSGSKKSCNQAVKVCLVLPTIPGRPKCHQNGKRSGHGPFSLPSRDWVLQAICVGDDTKVVMATRLRQQGQQEEKEIEEHTFATCLQSPWWVPHEAPEGIIVPLTYYYFAEDHSCTNPSNLIFYKTQGE